MAHDPSSTSKLLLPECRTRNLEAIVHLLLCPGFWYQTNLVPEYMTDHQSYWYEIKVLNVDRELGLCDRRKTHEISILQMIIQLMSSQTHQFKHVRMLSQL